MKKITIVCLSLSLSLFFACGGKKLSNKEMFETNFQNNVKECVSVMRKVNLGIDSTSAAAQCSCMLKNAYLIDSTTVKMNGDEFSKFVNANRAKLDSLCSLPNKQ